MGSNFIYVDKPFRFFDKGNDVEIPANAAIDLVLMQPITVSSASYFHEN